jgi:hypothetical protein
MKDFSMRHSIDQARVVLDSAVKNQPELAQALAGPVDKIMGPLKEALISNSDLCRDDFAAMLARATPQATPAFLAQLGLDVATGQGRAETADSEGKKKTSDDVVDELVRSDALIGAVTTPWAF